MTSRITQFLFWRFYRTKVVPACILLALLSILFGGALVVQDTLATGPARDVLTAGKLNEIVVKNLLAASLLMLCHATYLALMAYHLVYRYPIERLQWVSLTYIAIAFAYVAHAFHTYLEATDRHWTLGAVWWSSAAFAVTYFALAYHGVREHSAKGKSIEGEPKRSTQKVRDEWMLGTDIAVCALATLMFVRATGLFDWGSWFQGGGGSGVIRKLSAIPLTHELYAQASPKDTLIAVALLVYALARFIAHRRLRASQTERNSKILAIQTIDGQSKAWADIRGSLPGGENWLDLACGQGRNVRELIEYLYKSNKGFPGEMIFLDKDCRALSAASSASPEWWPKTARETYQFADMNSLEGRKSLERCKVVHMGHTAYEPAVARAALRLLRSAVTGTKLVVRYTSDASFYRVISVSSACAVFRPYIYHHTHKLLLDDLKSAGWEEKSTHIIARTCDISAHENREAVVNWCDIQYGEFSGDVIERYLKGLADDGPHQVLNADRVVLLQKS